MSAESRIEFSPILAPPRGNHINFQPLLFAFYTVDLLSCIQLGYSVFKNQLYIGKTVSKHLANVCV